MPTESDPRQIVTPEAFSVSPDLLGLPLAHPWRRAAAMLVDLLLVAVLANARGVFLAFAGGAFLFWLAFRGRKAGLGSKMARATIGCAGSIVVFVAVLAIWGSIFTDIPAVIMGDGEGVPGTLGAVGDLASLLSSNDSVEAEAAASRILGRLQQQGVAPDEVREALGEMEGDSPAVRAVERALAAAGPGQEPVTGAAYDTLGLDSLLARYEAARSAGDSAAERLAAPALGRRLVREDWDAREGRIQALESRAERLSAELDDTEAALEAERNKGPIATVVGFLDAMGLGIGWSGLYFTFFTAFWRGRTPGKRLFGLRVVRLDGGSLSYWASFERFGGYAASLFTGMEGFLRILWDRNRQCLQDKLAETVVIRETRAARAQLAVSAAKRGLEEKPWTGGPIRGT